MSHLSIVTVLVLGLMACSTVDPGTDPNGQRNSFEQAVTGWPDLQQVVRLSPGDVRSGDRVTITSTVINRGDANVPVETRICDLGLAGDLEVSAPPDMGVCAGYSMSHTLGPGDSVTTVAIRIVNSRPGTHRLDVHQMVNPHYIMPVNVTVR